MPRNQLRSDVSQHLPDLDQLLQEARRLTARKARHGSPALLTMCRLRVTVPPSKSHIFLLPQALAMAERKIHLSRSLLPAHFTLAKICESASRPLVQEVEEHHYR